MIESSTPLKQRKNTTENNKRAFSLRADLYIAYKWKLYIFFCKSSECRFFITSVYIAQKNCENAVRKFKGIRRYKKNYAIFEQHTIKCDTIKWNCFLPCASVITMLCSRIIYIYTKIAIQKLSVFLLCSCNSLGLNSRCPIIYRWSTSSTVIGIISMQGLNSAESLQSIKCI